MILENLDCVNTKLGTKPQNPLTGVLVLRLSASSPCLPADRRILSASLYYLCSCPSAAPPGGAKEGLCYYTILISISTPAGRFKLDRDSMIFWLGFRMSIRRLCTRSSNCSLEFLSMKVERLTVYFLTSVGNGIGPTTLASFLSAVSIIWRAELSMSLWS